MTNKEKGYELYISPLQKAGPTDGPDLRKHLQDEGLISRALSPESELVKGWLAHPETYPEELLGLTVFLWGGDFSSKSGAYGPTHLRWRGGKVHLRRRHVAGRKWKINEPALLTPA